MLKIHSQIQDFKQLLTIDDAFCSDFFGNVHFPKINFKKIPDFRTQKKQKSLRNALITGQYEGAAALIAYGAHLELQNSRRKSARDFAQELSVPQFLLEAFEGKPEACHKMVEVAASNFTFGI